MKNTFLTTNTILYCRKWEKTVGFYRDRLRLPVLFSTTWFVEFQLNDASRLSIADETRATVKGSGGRGITISWEVGDIGFAWDWAQNAGAMPTGIREHPWGARVFYLWDPEGHRIEFWQSSREINGKPE